VADLLNDADLYNSYSKELGAHMRAAVKAYMAFEQAEKEASAFFSGVSTRVPFRDAALTEAYRNWLKGILRGWSYQYNGSSGKMLSVDDIEGFTTIHQAREGRDPTYNMRCGHVSMDEYLEACLKEFDFEGLINKIKQEAKGLESAGLQESANLIISALSLGSLYDNGYGEAPTKQGKIVFCRYSIYLSFGSYNSDLCRKWGELAGAFEAAECETGCHGWAAGCREIAEAFQQRRSVDGPFESRTILAGDCALSAQVFKDHLKLRFSPEDMASLMAFLRLHGTYYFWDSKGVA
tara:strand:+ start:3777 stop:4655 length:879 start_codon:yes stop_codon:yes gene_type:complete